MFFFVCNVIYARETVTHIEGSAQKRSRRAKTDRSYMDRHMVDKMVRLGASLVSKFTYHIFLRVIDYDRSR